MTIPDLKIYQGFISGKGSDNIGQFEIQGSLSNGKTVNFTKRYIGAHTVNYQGTLTSDSQIDGTWSLQGMSDAFQLKKAYSEPDPHVPPPAPPVKVPLPVSNYSSNDIWKGFYDQNGQQTPMTFTMFSATPGNQVTGTGSDNVGQFQINGTCDPQGNVIFTKQYVGQHAVAYSGKLIGGTISGNWTL